MFFVIFDIMKSLVKAISLLLFIAVVSSSCTKKDSWKTIEIGDYLFDFPADFELKKERGIDSYVGKINGDSISFGFDFGYFSDDFGETEEEFIENKNWRYDAAYQFMKPGITYDNNNSPKIEVIGTRKVIDSDSMLKKGIDYIGYCKYDTLTFIHPITIPDEIKKWDFKIDTINNLYRRMVLPKDSVKGFVGVYLHEVNGFDESKNNYLSISIGAYCLTMAQQELVIKILKTGRHK